MTEPHLSDRQIQEYLDSRAELDDSSRKHLESCTACRKSLEFYRTLSARLESADRPSLTPGFEDRVMLRITQEGCLPIGVQRVWRHAGMVVLGWVLLGLVAILAIVYFTPDMFGKMTAFGLESFRSISASLQAAMKPVFTEFSVKPLIILFAGLTLLGTVLLDRIIVRYRRTRRLISLMV